MASMHRCVSMLRRVSHWLLSVLCIACPLQSLPGVVAVDTPIDGCLLPPVDVQSRATASFSLLQRRTKQSTVAGAATAPFAPHSFKLAPGMRSSEEDVPLTVRAATLLSMGARGPKGLASQPVLLSGQSLEIDNTSFVQNVPSEKSSLASSGLTLSFLDSGNLLTYGSWLMRFAPNGLMDSIGGTFTNMVSGMTASSANARRHPPHFPTSRIGGLLLELHLPSISFQSLHTSMYASMADFLMKLRTGLSRAAEIGPQRVNILGIHERYLRGNDWQYNKEVGKAAGDREVVVRFVVMPDSSSDKDPQMVVELLRDTLADSGSSLMTGSLGTALVNSTISLSLTPGLTLTPVDEQERAARISSIALPIGISAAFTGILVWLAAL